LSNTFRSVYFWFPAIRSIFFFHLLKKKKDAATVGAKENFWEFFERLFRIFVKVLNFDKEV